MTRIGELLAGGPSLSYEFFPPKTPKAHRDLEKTLQDLATTEPDFVSVTYGALGATRDTTHEIVNHIHADIGLVVMPHLTCVGHSRGELVTLLRQYRDEGIENVLALGGDPPADPAAKRGDFRYAAELIEVIREIGGFHVGVAAFPEGHPRSTDRQADRRHLAAKLEMADFGITQFFFDADVYFRMRDELAELGCHTPVLAGVMPVMNVERARAMAAMNGAEFPAWLDARFRGLDSREDVERMGTEVATELTLKLVEGGAPGIHLYALNRSGPAKAVIGAAGLRARGRG